MHRGTSLPSPGCAHTGKMKGRKPKRQRARTSTYPYTKHLKILDGRRPQTAAKIPDELKLVRTPLVQQEWERCLASHPDRAYCDYLLKGMKEGFRVGFQYDSHTCKRSKANMLSASKNPEVVEKYLDNEVQLGRVVGPLELDAHPKVQTSRFGVIEKPHQPGKYRLIVDLSDPEGSSVNDGIEREICTLHYTSVEEAMARVCARGRGTNLAKFDIESAFRIIPVHPDDRKLLGMEWKGKLFVDTALPFGLRSAPKIFNTVADAMQWIFEQEGIESLHYLDDFLIFGAPDTQECKRNISQVLERCAKLGVPIAAHKTEGPSTIITFLGIELNTRSMTIRLPDEKLSRLKKEIQQWNGRYSCTKQELQSLVGQLHHACCVVKPGRTFLRRMLDLLRLPTASKPHHHIRLNKGFQSDLRWWATFLPRWNGIRMFAEGTNPRIAATITSDASGSWGCGAFTSMGEWFQFAWPTLWKDLDITVKELLPIVLAVAMWGHRWEEQSVQCLCDNAAVVAIINTGSSKCKWVMHLMRSLFFFTAMHNITLIAQHIPGAENRGADALSRNDHLSFLAQVPEACRTPSSIPQALIQALVLQRPDWTSKPWRELLAACSQRAWRTPPSGPTRAAKTGSSGSVKEQE